MVSLSLGKRRSILMDEKKETKEYKVDRLDLFPVPIFGAHYEHAESLAQTLIPMFHKMEKEDENPTPYSANGYTNYTPGKSVMEWIECNDLRNWIGSIAMEMNKLHGLESDIQFVGSWFSINRQHTYHEAHNHMPCTWSGVYYVQAEDDDAVITFYDKNKEENWPWANYREPNQYNTPSYSVTPKTGRLIIFPSHLKHGVAQQKVDRERITISFNLSNIETYR